VAAHHQTEAANVQLLGRQRRAEPPAIEHGDAVGEHQELVQILRDQEDTGAAGAGGEQAPVDVRDRADVEAAGRTWCNN
jgi:hypothetical protein